jgi:hypothetical protein
MENNLLPILYHEILTLIPTASKPNEHNGYEIKRAAPPLAETIPQL